MAEHSSRKHTIIIADDCEDIRLMMRLMLEVRGYLVLEAENGAAAIELALRNRPDLILMDIDMPVLDGLSATKRLRDTEELRHIPVIVVTANAPEKCRTEVFAAGCNEFLSKPINFGVLDRLMQNLLTA